MPGASSTAFGQTARDHVRISLACGEAVLREAIGRPTAWYHATNGGRLLAWT